MSAPLLFALVDSTGNAVPLYATPDGRLIVQVEGLDGLQVNVGPSVEISNDLGNPIPVSGPLTNEQLRAAAIPVAGPLTNEQLRAAALRAQGVAIAADGQSLALDSLAQALAYDASGRLSTVTVEAGGVTYRRTLTYDASDRVSNVSAWVVV